MSPPELIRVEAGPRVGALFTTRRGGVSAPPFDGANLATSTGDDPGAVRRNREALCEAAGVPPERVSMLRQVHGAEVLEVGEPLRPGRFCGALAGWPEADAMVSAASRLPLVVLAADCVPVLLWRLDGSGVGAAHAGWKGMISGVIQAACAALPGSGPVRAAIGPCIDRANYEVDEGLARRFGGRFGADAVDGRHVDLRTCARISLGEGGLRPAEIEDVLRSTAETDSFFSHRAEGGRTGRQAGVVWIE